MIGVLIYAVILLSALPVGWVLAWLCKEELVDGKKWFKLMIVSFIVLGGVSFIVFRDLPIALSLGYMVLVTGVSLFKGNDKKFIAP